MTVLAPSFGKRQEGGKLGASRTRESCLRLCGCRPHSHGHRTCSRDQREPWSQAGLEIADIDTWELNEAFAAQSLAVLPANSRSIHPKSIEMEEPSLSAIRSAARSADSPQPFST